MFLGFELQFMSFKYNFGSPSWNRTNLSAFKARRPTNRRPENGDP